VNTEYDETASDGRSPDATAHPATDTAAHEGGRSRQAAPGGAGQPRKVRWTALVVAAVVVIGIALVGFNWLQGRKTSDTGAVPTNPGPVIMAKADLPQLVTFTGHTVYWAGPQGLDSFEVTLSTSADGKLVYIRYLPKGVAAGSKDPYLTVGTYEKKGAYAGLEAAARVSGAKSEKLAGGALVVQPAGKPTSAYFGFAGADLLMEVYDPTPGKALQLIQSGAVQPV
jgi:hypothetical protein